MRIAVLADIHGNIYALEAILKSLKTQGIDRCLFCGDFCGYYYAQDEVIGMISQQKNWTSILGNHDKIFLEFYSGKGLPEDYSAKYGGALEYLKETIQAKNWEYLKNLPESFEDAQKGIAVFHGSPWDALNEYIYPTDDVDRFKDLPWKYVLLGHTHYAMHKKIKDVQIINPGSCGQPRDGKGASYAILDLEFDRVDLGSVSYNHDALKDDLIRHGEKNKYLFEILDRKRT